MPRQRLASPSHLPTAPRLACAAAAPTGRVRVPLSEDATPRCPSTSELSPLPGRLRRHEHEHGPPPATVAPPRRRDTAAELDFFSSPSTRSSGELAFCPPCPAGSLTVVGARPPPFVPSPPQWRRRRPRRDARVGAVTAPVCAAPSRAVLAEAGPASAGHARVAAGRTRAVHVGRVDAVGVGHTHCATGPSANSAQCTRLNFINF
jgi:hypothetical protein